LHRQDHADREDDVRGRHATPVLLIATVAVGCGSGSGTPSAGPSATTGPVATSDSPASSGTPASDHPAVPAWDEPADYRFAVSSTCGERAFVGDYRVTVRGGAVARAQWLHPDGQRWVPVEPEHRDDVPTLGDVLDEESCYLVTDYAVGG
jgi:hypothetical protein